MYAGPECCIDAGATKFFYVTSHTETNYSQVKSHSKVHSIVAIWLQLERKQDVKNFIDKKLIPDKLKNLFERKNEMKPYSNPIYVNGCHQHVT